MVAGTMVAWLLGSGVHKLILAAVHLQEMTVRGAFFAIIGWLVLLALAFSTLVGVLSGLYPVDGALLDSIGALRHE